jgi:hypothetical protein
VYRKLVWSPAGEWSWRRGRRKKATLGGGSDKGSTGCQLEVLVGSLGIVQGMSWAKGARLQVCGPEACQLTLEGPGSW